MPPVDRDRSRIDDVALHPVREQQAMNPKPVQSRFLNDDRFDLRAVALLGLRPRPRKKVKQPSAVSTLDHMLGKLLAAGTVDRDNPFRFAQFERGEQRDTPRAVVATAVAEVTDGIGCLHAGVEAQPAKSGRRPPA